MNRFSSFLRSHGLTTLCLLVSTAVCLPAAAQSALYVNTLEQVGIGTETQAAPLEVVASATTVGLGTQ